MTWGLNLMRLIKMVVVKYYSTNSLIGLQPKIWTSKTTTIKSILKSEPWFHTIIDFVFILAILSHATNGSEINLGRLSLCYWNVYTFQFLFHKLLILEWNRMLRYRIIVILLHNLETKKLIFYKGVVNRACYLNLRKVAYIPSSYSEAYLRLFQRWIICMLSTYK